MRCIIYTRISTVGQEDNTSLLDQLARCRTYAAQHGMTVAAELQDIESGGNLDRVGFTKLRTLVREHLVDAVLALRVDRLSRSVLHYYMLLAELIDTNCELHFADGGKVEDISGALQHDKFAVLIAEAERQSIAKRTRDGKRATIAAGRVLGHGLMSPYGYKYEGLKRDKRLVVVDDEAQIVEWMFEWYASGLSIYDITEKLTTLAVPTPAETRPVTRRVRAMNQWNPTTINRILKNHTYHGIMFHYKLQRKNKKVTTRPESEWLGVVVPAIVSQELFDTVQARLARGQQMSPRSVKHEYLLGRMLTCACGRTLYGDTTDNVQYYRCAGRSRAAANRCTVMTKRLRSDALDALVWNKLVDELTPGVLLVGLQERAAQADTIRATLLHDLDYCARRDADLGAQQQRLVDGFRLGVLTSVEVTDGKKQIAIARKEVDAERTKIEQQIASAGPSSDDIRDLLAQAANWQTELPVFTFARRRKLLEAMQFHAQLIVDDAGARWLDLSAIVPLGASLSLAALFGGFVPNDGVVTPSYLSLSSNSIDGVETRSLPDYARRPPPPQSRA